MNPRGVRGRTPGDDGRRSSESHAANRLKRQPRPKLARKRVRHNHAAGADEPGRLLEDAASDVRLERRSEVGAIRQVESLEENGELQTLAELELLAEASVQLVEGQAALAAECNLVARAAGQARPQLRGSHRLGAEQVVRIAIEHDRMRSALAATEPKHVGDAFSRGVRPRGSPLHDRSELDAPRTVDNAAQYPAMPLVGADVAVILRRENVVQIRRSIAEAGRGAVIAARAGQHVARVDREVVAP